MASCETSTSPADEGEEKQPLTAAEPLLGAAYRPGDGDGFSDISDSELVAAQDETLNDSRASACILDTVEPVEGTDLKVKIFEDLETGDDVFYTRSREDNKNTEHSSEASQRKRKQPQTPMEKYHLKNLGVTSLCSQTWCEQQMVYEIELSEFIEPDNSEAKNIGSSIHLARELEVNDLVSLVTQSKEDAWAIKFLNVLAMLPVLQSGGCIREFPVFGEVDGVFIVGVIDELCYSSKGELELRELKTRQNPTLPARAQKRRNHFQVWLYKLLFDSMVSGNLQPDIVLRYLQLNPEQSLGPDIKEHASKLGITVSKFKDLLELTCLNLVYSDLPVIKELKIEYRYQEDMSLLGCDVVSFTKARMLEQLTFCLAFWKGLRETQGVEIEEAWKCRKCTFSNICEWKTRQYELTQAKRLK